MYIYINMYIYIYIHMISTGYWLMFGNEHPFRSARAEVPDVQLVTFPTKAPPLQLILAWEARDAGDLPTWNSSPLNV